MPNLHVPGLHVPNLADTRLLLEFAFTSLLIELTPGPNMAYLATVAVGRGRAAALRAVLGVATGLACVGILAAVGLAALIEASPHLTALLRWGGIAYLLWLAYDAWRGEAEKEAGFASFQRGFITNLLNPKAAMFYMAVLPLFLPAGQDGLWRNLLLVAIYVAVATGVHAALVLGAAHFRRLLNKDAERQRLQRLMALALVLVAGWFAWSTR